MGDYFLPMPSFWLCGIHTDDEVSHNSARCRVLEATAVDSPNPSLLGSFPVSLPPSLGWGCSSQSLAGAAVSWQLSFRAVRPDRAGFQISAWERCLLSLSPCSCSLLHHIHSILPPWRLWSQAALVARVGFVGVFCSCCFCCPV